MGWLGDMFFGTGRVLVYSASKDEEYMRVMNRLDDAGVRYRLRTIGSNRNMGAIWSNEGNPVQYHFYVRKEDVDTANRAIHTRD